MNWLAFFVTLVTIPISVITGILVMILLLWLEKKIGFWRTLGLFMFFASVVMALVLGLTL